MANSSTSKTTSPPKTLRQAVDRAQADGQGDGQPGQELESGRAVTGEVVSATPAVDTLIGWCQARMEAQDAEDANAVEGMIRQILAGSDAATVFRTQLPKNGKDFTDIPFELNAFTIRESEYDEGEGAPYYASLEGIVVETGEACVVNCGGWMVLAALAAAEVNQLLPQVVEIKAAETRKKRTALRLILVDQADRPGF